MAERATSTTFGSAMSLAEDARLSEAFALGAWTAPHRGVAGAVAAVERDVAVTDHRWRGAVRAAGGEYVPGDIVRVRALASTWLLDLATRQWQSANGGDAGLPANDRELALVELLYAAVPYFLPAAPALGIMASQPPDGALLGDLRVPYPAVAVFFSAPFEVPDELRGGEDQLGARTPSGRTIRDVLTGTEPSPTDAPTHIRHATLAAYRGHPLSVAAVVVTAGLDGSLGELVAFVLAEPVAPKTRFHVVEGNLAHSHLHPLVVNLAAAVAWGAWTPPDRSLDLPADPRSAAFRGALRRGLFRRLEPRGAAAEVRVLDAAKMTRPRVDARSGEAHASPATHLRRGHWQRYRVGPRSDWRYEPRWVPPVVVNPNADRGRTLTVFRLPLPPAPVVP